MDRGQAQALFQKADDFYRSERYEEALNVLNKLDDAFPDRRNILFPRARCLRRLKRPQEAMAICDRLIERFGDKRATKLKTAIASAEAASQRESSVGFTPLTLEDLGISKPPSEPVPSPRSKRQGARITIVMVLAVLAIAVIGLVVLLSRIRS